MKIRDYQQNALNHVLSHKEGFNGLIVAPTGTGKSVMLTSVVQAINTKWLILQPTKEILEQNLEKLKKACDPSDIGVFSASMNTKDFDKKITLATPNSVVKKIGSFKGYNLIIDEAHLVNPEQGRYKDIILALKPTYLVGYTATPYRAEVLPTKTVANRCVLNEHNKIRFINQETQKYGYFKLYKDEPFIVQNTFAFNSGYLCKIEFNHDFCKEYDVKKIKSKGMEFDEESLMAYHNEIGLYNELKILIELVKNKHKKILVFLTTVQECLDMQHLLKQYELESIAIHGGLNKSDRANAINLFKNGNINICLNVQTLTTGFDMPELDCIIMARPTSSLSLYTQIIGRATRPAEGKIKSVIYDVVNNYKRFGNPALWQLQKKDERYFLFCNETTREITYKKQFGRADYPDVIPTYVYWACGKPIRATGYKELSIAYSNLLKNKDVIIADLQKKGRIISLYYLEDLQQKIGETLEKNFTKD